MTLTFGSLFAGIGGFDLGFEQSGMRGLWQCEKDAQASSVLARHWPDVPRYDDVEALDATVPVPDVLCGGFPCTDVSVAGRRAGLAGKQSGLFYAFATLIDVLRPRWVVVENVPGLLSSNGGRDMGTVVGTLGELGYGWAYRCLDAQYDGLAQRRVRVFIVACAGDGAAGLPARVLFEPESVPGDPPPRREAGADVARTLTSGAANGRGVRDAGRRSEDDANLAVVNCLDSHMGGGGVDNNAAQAGHVVAFQERGREGGRVCETQAELAYSLTAPNGGGRSQENRVAYHCQGSNVGPMGSLRAGNGNETGGVRDAKGADSDTKPGHLIPVDLQNTRVGGDVAGTLDTTRPSRGGGQGLLSGTMVRRLTPRECERLQGFPDDWTRYADDGREISNSARYRMLGNAVAVPVAKWIGRRLMEHAP